jgi:TRAP-type C4-dicarboxylate transport system permease small subunit
VSEDSAPTSRFDAALDRAVEVTAIIGFTGLVFIAFLTMADVTLRYLGWLRIPGFKDLGEVVYAIVIGSCFPAGLKKGNAVTIRVVGKALGPRFHAWFDLIGAAVTLVLFILIAWQMAALSWARHLGGRTTSTLEWPTSPVWWLVTILMVACVVVQSWVVLQAWYAARAGVPRPVHDEQPLE